MFWERDKKVDFRARMRNVQKIDHQADIVETIYRAIDRMFPRISNDTKVERNYSQGLFHILVSQSGAFLFDVEVDFKREGQELRVDWGPELGSEFIHTDYLDKLFTKISLKCL